MATPVVAGSVALVRQYFMEGRYPSGSPNANDAFTPSGALLKAMIVHSGKQMTGNVRGVAAFPSIVQGFGRIDLDSVLKIGNTEADRGTVWILASKIGATRVELQQGQTYQQTFTLNQAGNFKATLVWMDAPASLNSRVNLVNDLDLLVQTGNTVYYPNGQTNQADTLNTVEMIEVAGNPGASYTVTVTARAIGSLPKQQGQPPKQPFALVVSGPFTALGAPTQPTQAPTQAPNPGQGTPAPPVSAKGFVKIASGKCSDVQKAPIPDEATCQEAAVELQLGDTGSTTIYNANRPEGCYYFQGVRLFLAVNPANVGRGSDPGIREQICGPTTSIYKKLASGTCTQQGLFAINDAVTCENAAKAMNLADTSVAYVSSTSRPEGCYYKDLLPGNALFMSVNQANAGNGAIGSREPICSPFASPPPGTQSGTGGTPAPPSNPGAGYQPAAIGSIGGTTRAFANVMFFFPLLLFVGLNLY